MVRTQNRDQTPSNAKLWAGKIAQRLRALALPKDLGSVPSIHNLHFTTQVLTHRFRKTQMIMTFFKSVKL